MLLNLLWAWGLMILHASAATTNVCKSGIYASIPTALSTYSLALSYCSSKYSRAPVTTTVTRSAATTSTSTIVVVTTTTAVVTATTTTTVTIPELDTLTDSTTATTTATVYQRKKLKRATTANSVASAWSVWQAKASSIVSTFCSCIETPATRTATITTTNTIGATTTSTSISTQSQTTINVVTLSSTSTTFSTITVTMTVTSTAVVTPIPCGTYPACDEEHDCPNQNAAVGPCTCQQLVDGGSACIDDSLPQGPYCNTNADCPPGEYCFTDCLGNECLPLSNKCANAAAISRLFRRDRLQKLHARNIGDAGSTGRNLPPAKI